MVVNDTMINASCEDVVSELRTQLAINHIPYLQKIRNSGENIQVQCPYHGGGQERKPSAGIRKDDGTFHCFRGDTKVITREYGAIEIKHLFNRNVHILNGNGEWEKVWFSNYGKQSLMKLTLSCNTKKKVIYATPEHEWLIHNYNRKYQTQELKPNMYLEKCVPKNVCDVTLDPQGIIHGFCYGDGNNYGHTQTYKTYYNRCYFYNEQDLELKQYFTNAEIKKGIAGNGKQYEYALFKSNRNLKNVPFIDESDSYLLGFLAGYFVADGNCFNNKLTIYSHKYDDLYRIQQICTKLGIMSTEIGTSNISKGKRGCIDVKADTHGYTLRLVRNTIPDNFFITAKGRNSVQKYTGRSRYKVVSVEQTDLVEDVYCCVTTTHSFTLEHFILTGNCFACRETHTLPEVISYCFGYKDDIFGKEGFKWIMKNFATVQVEERKDVKVDCSRITGDSFGVSKDKNITRNYVLEEELDTYRYNHPYWTKRGITSDWLIELFDLGYDKDTNCITFPVRDIQGNCLFVARRSVVTKWFNYPSGAEKPLYGLYELNQSELMMRQKHGVSLVHNINEIYITESMIDCLRLWQNNRYAVALNGTGSESQFEQLRKLSCRKLILATDNDKAGLYARDRIKKAVRNKIITQVVIPDGKKDIGDLTDEEIQNLEEIW